MHTLTVSVAFFEGQVLLLCLWCLAWLYLEEGPRPSRECFVAPRALMSSRDDDISEITAAVGELTINGSGNSVHINVGTGGSSRRHPLPAAGKAASKAAPKRAAARGAGGSERYYVIAECSRRPEAIGIWKATWGRVCQELPGGQLFGSTARPCKGVDTLEEAIEIWAEWRPEESPVVRSP